MFDWLPRASCNALESSSRTDENTSFDFGDAGSNLHANFDGNELTLYPVEPVNKGFLPTAGGLAPPASTNSAFLSGPNRT